MHVDAMYFNQYDVIESYLDLNMLYNIVFLYL